MYTLDKVIQQSLKCLQAVSNDETATKLIGIFMYHRMRRQHAEGGMSPRLYRDHVAISLRNTLEEVYRIQFVSDSLCGYEKDATVSCEYLGIQYVYFLFTTSYLLL